MEIKANMPLNEAELKQYVIEHGKCSENTYFFTVSKDCGLTCGCVEINRKGEAIFNKNIICLRYNADKDKLQQKTRTSLKWRDINVNTSGLKKRIIFAGNDVKGILKNFRKDNADEIARCIQRFIKNNLYESRCCLREIESIKKHRMELFEEMRLLEEAAECTHIPDYMEDIKKGDEFETRCGVIVKCKGIELYSRPCFSPVRNLHLFEGLRTDYSYSTRPNGMMQSLEDVEGDESILETEFDIVRKL